MCGIFGIVCDASGMVDNNLLREYLKDMFLLSSNRGKEASGLAIRHNNEIKVLKKGLPYNLFIKSRDYAEYIQENLNSIKDKKNVSIIGHTRLSTNGSGNFDLNNHPIIAHNIVGIHNGIVTDCRESNTSLLKDTNNSDSEFCLTILILFRKNIRVIIKKA